MFIDALIEKIEEKKSPICVGLDTILDYVPEFLVKESFKKEGKNLEGAARAIWKFNKEIIKNIKDMVPAVKLQLACYEMYGIDGIKVFHKTCRFARENGLLVIADGKRNDIGSSASFYAEAYLGKTSLGEGIEQEAFCVDALTVNPYLGEDGIKPFVDTCSKTGKGIFVLVKTSNKSSGQIQDLQVTRGGLVYERVGDLVKELGNQLVGKHGYSSVGAVVGATYPEQGKALRENLKHTFFLVPGFGAQGAGVKDIKPLFDDKGRGAIINASRSVMLAYRNEKYSKSFEEVDFAKASRAEVLSMKEQLK